EGGAQAVVAGRNYGQGSSREHAVLAPRYLGLRLVLAGSYARIHWQNLVNFGVLPLEFADADTHTHTHTDHPAAGTGDRLAIRDVAGALRGGGEVTVDNLTKGTTIRARHRLSPRQIDMLLAGGRTPAYPARRA